MALTGFGLPGLMPMEWLVRRFRSEEAKALLAGVGAHSMSLTAPLTSAFGTLLTMTAHAVGWPVVKGGSSAITDAQVAELERLGGTIVTGQWVGSLAELPPSTAVVLDTSPKTLVDIAGTSLPDRYRRALRRFRYGAGRVQDRLGVVRPGPLERRGLPPGRDRAPRRHVRRSGGQRVRCQAGEGTRRPYCIIVQAGVADPGRAPDGRRPCGATATSPPDRTVDMTSAVEAQIERFAPGFSDLVLARSVLHRRRRGAANPNYVGGDIAGGASTLVQTVFRPTVQWNPYRTPLDDLYLCSASTAPGGGVHGMCGVYAARTCFTITSVGRPLYEAEAHEARALVPSGRAGGGRRHRGSAGLRRRCRDWTVPRPTPGRLPGRYRRRPRRSRRRRTRPDLARVIHHARLRGDQASHPWHTSNHASPLATRKHTEPKASGLQMC